MIRTVVSAGFHDYIHYRYVCEKCGFHSHWIDFQVVSGVSDTVHFGNQDTIASQVVDAAKRGLSGEMDRLEREMQQCFGGQQAASRSPYTIYNVFKAAEKCPKCGHVPSWLPVQFLFKKKAAKYNAATPVISEPEVVFGGKTPADEYDFDMPCCVEIIGNTITFGTTSASFYLNANYLGEYTNGTNFTAQTRFRDNVIRLKSPGSDIPLLTFYFEAQSGKTMRYQFTGRRFELM